MSRIFEAAASESSRRAVGTPRSSLASATFSFTTSGRAASATLSRSPSASSATWTPAARFLKLVSEAEPHRGSKIRTFSRIAPEEMAIAKHLLIVARHRRELYDQIKRAFAGHETVQVVLDRRATERRRGKEPTLPERRGADRRARSIIDDQLRTIGWSLVLLDLAKSKRS